MAHHNKTPESVLNAPPRLFVALEGTEHEGPNRREMRAWGRQEGHSKPSMSVRKKSEHWLMKLFRERQEDFLAAQAEINSE